ncbi:MAG TPA: lipopolysaccharide kinase InaA family protein [Myxococcota bacterium]
MSRAQAAGAPGAPVRWSRGDLKLCRSVEAALAGGAAAVVTDDARRRTLRVAAAGRPLLVKQFRVGSGRHPAREAVKARIGRAPADREWRALAALHAAGLPVPEPLALGALPDGDRLLVLSWIEGVPFEAALLAAAPPARRALLVVLGRLLARLHAAGWVHGDLHPGNLLVRAGAPVLLDWQRARRTRAPQARARDLARLEHALAHHVPLSDRMRLRAAALALERPFDDPARAALRAAGEAVERRAVAFARGRTRRLLRPGRLVARAQVGALHGLRLRTLAPETLHALLAAHEEALAAHDERVLKDDHRARVTCHRVGDQALVVKEAPWRGAARALADRVRGSAARRAWRAGHGIALRGIGVARPQAWLEERRAGVPVRSWVVLEDVRPGVPAAFALEHGFAADEVLDTLGRLLVVLHRRGVDHGDLQGTHVYLRRAGDRLETRLIDLEAVRFRTPLPERRRIQALAELHASLPDAFPNAARLRVWRRYVRALPFTIGARRALERVVRESLARRHRWSGCTPRPVDG